MNPEEKDGVIVVSFMPWAGLRSSVQIGPVQFWPFYTDCDARIKHEPVRSRLTKYFDCYVDHRGRPPRTVAICSLKDDGFRELTNEERMQTTRARDALLFCVIGPRTVAGVGMGNCSMAPPNTERYELLFQRLPLDSDTISIQSGINLEGGLNLEEVRFTRPWSIGGIFDRPTETLLAAFSDALDDTDRDAFKTRLFRSLEWFRYAHIGSDQVSPLSRVVMMATAFEILLSIPNKPRKKDVLRDMVDATLFSKMLTNETRSIGKKSVTATKAGWWAWDFYDIRNSIVHGDEVDQDTLCPGDWNHLIVADVVFTECVERLLQRNGYGECLAYSDLSEKSRSICTREQHDRIRYGSSGFSGVHSALGWRQ